MKNLGREIDFLRNCLFNRLPNFRNYPQLYFLIVIEILRNSALLKKFFSRADANFAHLKVSQGKKLRIRSEYGELKLNVLKRDYLPV